MVVRAKLRGRSVNDHGTLAGRPQLGEGWRRTDSRDDQKTTLEYVWFRSAPCSNSSTDEVNQVPRLERSKRPIISVDTTLLIAGRADMQE